MEPFSPPQENLLYFRKWIPSKNLLYFLKRKLFLYFRNLEKIMYISGNGTFLYFGKGIFRTLAYLELEAYFEP